MDFWSWQRGEAIAALATLADAVLSYLAISSGRFKESWTSRAFSSQPWAPAALMLLAHFAARWFAWDGFWSPSAQGRLWAVAAVLHGAAALWGLSRMRRR